MGDQTAAIESVSLLQNYLLVGALLFVIGLAGFLSRRNMIIMFLAVELMLQGVSVSLVGWGRFHNNWGGQALTIFILTVAACEAAIGLALVTVLYRASGKLDIAVWQQQRESSQPPYVDHELPEPPSDGDKQWPQLTPAGIEPEIPERELIYRSHV